MSKYKVDNLSSAGFYTYAYRAFQNHLNNLNKKYVYKVRTPCNKKCPFHVPATKECLSPNVQANCTTYAKYQESLRVCIMLGKSDDKMLDLAKAHDYDIPKETIDDMVSFFEGEDRAFFVKSVCGLLRGDRIAQKTREKLGEMTRQYIRHMGVE